LKLLLAIGRHTCCIYLRSSLKCNALFTTVIFSHYICFTLGLTFFGLDHISVASRREDVNYFSDVVRVEVQLEDKKLWSWP